MAAPSQKPNHSLVWSRIRTADDRSEPVVSVCVPIILHDGTFAGIAGIGLTGRSIAQRILTRPRAERHNGFERIVPFIIDPNGIIIAAPYYLGTQTRADGSTFLLPSPVMCSSGWKRCLMIPKARVMAPVIFIRQELQVKNNQLQQTLLKFTQAVVQHKRTGKSLRMSRTRIEGYNPLQHIRQAHGYQILDDIMKTVTDGRVPGSLTAPCSN